TLFRSEITLGAALQAYREAILKIRDVIAVDAKVAATALGRHPNHPWDSVVVTENGSLADAVMPALPPGFVSSIELYERTGEPLSASAWIGSRPEIEVEAAPEIFSARAAKVLARTWLTTIEVIAAADPSTRLGDLEIFPADDLEALRKLESGGDALAGDQTTIWQAFDKIASSHPQAPALGYAEEFATYSRLREAAESLASALHAAGTRAGDRVASRIDDRRYAALAVLACARLQAVYMPFDADIPSERVQRMIEVAEPKAIIRDGPEEPATAGLPHIHPDQHSAGDLPPFVPHDPFAPFCLLFTSGSTGEPKGVINHHHGILNEVLAVGKMLGIGPSDRVLQFASLGFDAALEEILGTLVAGAMLVPRQEAILGSFDRYQEFIEAQRITIADLPTAYWAAWCAWLAENEKSPPSCVRGVIIGGEKAGAASTLAWNRACDSSIPVFNTYGPTETAIVATASRLVVPDHGGDPPIGRPLPGLRARIVDGHGRIAALGRAGELWLGGAGVGLGYWKRPETTAEVFITEPGSSRPDWYRTGDLAKMDDHGILHFLGRADDQVKIRGKRIEPGEIQARLEAHEHVRRAHVGARNIKGQMILVAWVVAPGEDAASLTAFLRKDLPGWMTPSAFVFLEDLPLNARGKVDRKKLPDPAAIEAPANEEAADGSPLEVWMASLFAEVLGVEADTVRYDLDFAEQGGDSLSAMALATRLRQAGVDLDPGELAADSSPKALADKIHNNYGKARTEWEPVLRLRAGNPENPPLVLIHATPGDVLGYANLVAELPRSIPCLGVVSRSLHLPDQPHSTIEEMAAAYIEMLTPRLEGKKWILGGWCYGGIVAYEMARQLVAAGKEAPLVIMIETWAQSPASGLQNLKLKLAKAMAVLTMPAATKKIWKEARKHHQAVAEGPAENSDGFARSAVYQANMLAVARHRMGSYAGEVHLFLSDNAAADGTLPVANGGWHVLGAKPVVHSHGGNHSLALRPPHVAGLAAGITKLLQGSMKV
ncbi:MAG: Peptide synthetase, partial [Akkermansiaceae bacterium]|nr:Peptide synthetase [Akkermansiaceae bacterium]